MFPSTRDFGESGRRAPRCLLGLRTRCRVLDSSDSRSRSSRAAVLRAYDYALHVPCHTAWLEEMRAAPLARVGSASSSNSTSRNDGIAALRSSCSYSAPPLALLALLLLSPVVWLISLFPLRLVGVGWWAC